MGWISDLKELSVPYVWFIAPSLNITFNSTTEPVQATVVDAGNQPGWFYRLDVTNSGRSVAEDCVATLVAVDPEVPPGQSLATPCKLKWAHGATIAPAVIEPDDP